jgi:heme-degrading monooxygenase HmoA
MEVLRSDADDEVLVITRWHGREAFDDWVSSDKFCTLPAKVPQLTITSVK